MKSNLIVITVAAALITTTVSHHIAPSPITHPCLLLSKLDLNNPNQCLFVSFCRLQIGLAWKVKEWGSWPGGAVWSGLLRRITSGCLNSIHFWCRMFKILSSTVVKIVLLLPLSPFPDILGDHLTELSLSCVQYKRNWLFLLMWYECKLALLIQFLFELRNNQLFHFNEMIKSFIIDA